LKRLDEYRKSLLIHSQKIGFNKSGLKHLTYRKYISYK